MNYTGSPFLIRLHVVNLCCLRGWTSYGSIDSAERVYSKYTIFENSTRFPFKMGPFLSVPKVYFESDHSAESKQNRAVGCPSLETSNFHSMKPIHNLRISSYIWNIRTSYHIF